MDPLSESTYFSKNPFNVKLVPVPTNVPTPPRLEAYAVTR